MVADDGHKPHGFRPAPCHGKHIDAKRVLQPCFLVKHVAEVLGVRAFFQIQHNADAFLRGLVGNIHNVAGLAGFHQMVYVHQEFPNICPYHGVGDFCNHQPLPPAFPLFRFHFSADFNFPCASFINAFQVRLVHHNPPSGEIRPLDVPHQFLRGNVRVFHVGLYPVYDFGKIMGRDAGCHAYGNAFCPVD